ncbi:hypothetical protein K443DRAFT_423110 [Laccaria amethystina LaAM-08-1]|uniref:Unplaced genomic scaffold K443scaffold_358, whole genome shotgun sequence n=1 Tax=Laccaria amethystina LaAM-08-1 TaxID=1095629 RepID=A0A0C9WIB8_9AGAR|nr:hypothetical protein K443DRAFT_423110 [Laccaria amethystina LaAM-08-1]
MFLSRGESAYITARPHTGFVTFVPRRQNNSMLQSGAVTFSPVSPHGKLGSCFPCYEAPLPNLYFKPLIARYWSAPGRLFGRSHSHPLSNGGCGPCFRV